MADRLRMLLKVLSELGGPVLEREGKSCRPQPDKDRGRRLFCWI